MTVPELPFPPASREAIAELQRTRKRIAFERAAMSPFFKGKLDGIRAEKLDDPEEWQKIPILDKEQLRILPPEDFHDLFCIAPRSEVVEYWRSGGSTGRPLFYPRSAEDIRLGAEGFRRFWLAADCGRDDLVHISFPLGIHPVGHLYARTAEALGIGTVWCGAGNNTPSEMQIELIRTLKPTVWAGMASYGLQLAQVAERMGFDLANSTVTKFLTAAEPVSPGKRERIERLWGAKLYDQFGSTEGSAMASESDCHDGLHFWTDMFDVEVIDEETGRPVAPGENGLLVFTPLWNSTMTPFLRWNSGDYVTYIGDGDTSGPLSVFPVIRHTARTSGFFKVRGVNINQADFEDFMHRQTSVTDFKAEALETETLDMLLVSVEAARGVSTETLQSDLAQAIRATFEITPELVVLEPGTLEKEFQTAVKQNRFVDRRG